MVMEKIRKTNPVWMECKVRRKRKDSGHSLGIRRESGHAGLPLMVSNP